MIKKLWLVGMCAIVLLVAPPRSKAYAMEEACQPDGRHVAASMCETNCCAGFCGACHADGHYICGHPNDT